MHIISFLSRWIARITALTLVTAPAWALQPPAGEVILTISGNIGDPTRPAPAAFAL